VGPALLWLPDTSGQWIAAGALLGVCLVAAALGSAWLPRLITALMHLLSRPRVRWAGLAALGLGLLAAAALDCMAVDDRLILEGAKSCEEADSVPPQSRPAPVRAETDRGRPVPLLETTEPRGRAQLDESERRLLGEWAAQARVIRVRPADDSTNCHGWV